MTGFHKMTWCVDAEGLRRAEEAFTTYQNLLAHWLVAAKPLSSPKTKWICHPDCFSAHERYRAVALVSLAVPLESVEATSVPAHHQEHLQ